MSGEDDERVDLLAAVRKVKITALFARQEFATHTELLAVTGTSLSTLRRDLDALEQAGVVRRIRGGAARPEGAGRDRGGQIERLLVQALTLVRTGDISAAEHCVARALQEFAQVPHLQPVGARDRIAMAVNHAAAGRVLAGRRP